MSSLRTNVCQGIPNFYTKVKAWNKSQYIVSCPITRAVFIGKRYILHPQKIQMLCQKLQLHQFCTPTKCVCRLSYLLLLKYTPEADLVWQMDIHANSFDSYKKVLLLSTVTCITYQLRCFADRLGLPIVNYWCQSLHWNIEQRETM